MSDDDIYVSTPTEKFNKTVKTYQLKPMQHQVESNPFEDGVPMYANMKLYISKLKQKIKELVKENKDLKKAHEKEVHQLLLEQEDRVATLEALLTAKDLRLNAQSVLSKELDEKSNLEKKLLKYEQIIKQQAAKLNRYKELVQEKSTLMDQVQLLKQEKFKLQCDFEELTFANEQLNADLTEKKKDLLQSSWTLLKHAHPQ